MTYSHQSEEDSDNTSSSTELGVLIHSIDALVKKSILPGNEVIRAYVVKNFPPIFGVLADYGNRSIQTEEELWIQLVPRLQKLVLDSIGAGCSVQDWALFIHVAAQLNDSNFFARFGRRLETCSSNPTHHGIDEVDIAICENWDRSTIFPVPLGAWKIEAARLAVSWLCNEDEDQFLYDAFRKRLKSLCLKSQSTTKIKRAEILRRDGALLMHGPTLALGKHQLEKRAQQAWWEKRKNPRQPDSGKD